MTVVAARVASDKLGVEVDRDAVGIQLDGQSPVRVGRGGPSSDWRRP
jgi:hypothetical protein